MNNRETVINISQIATTEDLESDLPISAILAKSAIPYSHRRIADNYVLLKKLCGFQITQPRILNTERNLLYKYNFNTLENSTIGQINTELTLLKRWSISTEDGLRKDSDNILSTRVKELKFILSNKYTTNSNELYNGYKAIELYLNEVTKFYSAH